MLADRPDEPLPLVDRQRELLAGVGHGGRVHVEPARVRGQRDVDAFGGEFCFEGGIAERESMIPVSNVMIVCPACGPVRIACKMDTAGGKLLGRENLGELSPKATTRPWP